MSVRGREAPRALGTRRATRRGASVPRKLELQLHRLAHAARERLLREHRVALVPLGAGRAVVAPEGVAVGVHVAERARARWQLTAASPTEGSRRRGRSSRKPKPRLRRGVPILRGELDEQLLPDAP